MKRTINAVKAIVFVALVMTGLSACQKDDNNSTPRVKKYDISAYPGYNISGSATFKEILNTDSVKLTITLQGSDVTDLTSFPVYIRQGTSLENGDIKFDVGNFDGSVGSLEKDLPISFSDIVGMNGSIAIYRNQSDLNTVIAQGEIGSNEAYKSYTLYDPLNSSAIDGQFRVYKRSGGSYLVIKTTLKNLDAACAGHPHPAGVYKANGAPDFELNPVADSSGISATPLPDHPFDKMITYDGSVKVLCSEEVQSFTLAEGKFK